MDTTEITLTIDPSDAEPPFEQLRVQVAQQVADGRLPRGTRLPTVRALAQQVGVAVNTVARAYRELEEDRVVVTEGRRGTFVASAGTSPETRAAAATYAASARRAGLGRAEAIRLLDDAW